MATTALTPVKFHGTTLHALTIDGKPHVSVGSVCNALTVDWSSQLKRIKRHPVLSASLVVMTMQLPGDDQKREVACLPLDMLNGWLFGISAARVKDTTLRARLVDYQRECFAVLAAHFEQPQAAPTTTRAFLTVINANGVPTVYPASDVGRLLYSPDSPFTADEAGQIARMATMRMKAEALALKQATGYGEVQKQVKALSTFQLGTLAEFAYHQLYERLCNEGKDEGAST